MLSFVAPHKAADALARCAPWAANVLTRRSSIAHLRQVNGDVDCYTDAAIGCCVVVYTRYPHIKASCTP